MHPGTLKTLRNLSIISWNARGLLHTDPRIRERKMKALYHHAINADIILLQAAHPEPSYLNKSFALFARHFHIKVSPCIDVVTGNFDYTKGGLVFLVKRTTIDKDAEIQMFEHIPGRAASITDSLGERDSTYWNVHNYGFSKADVLFSAQEDTYTGSCMQGRSFQALALAHWRPQSRAFGLSTH